MHTCHRYLRSFCHNLNICRCKLHRKESQYTRTCIFRNNNRLFSHSLFLADTVNKGVHKLFPNIHLHIMSIFQLNHKSCSAQGRLYSLRLCLRSIPRNKINKKPALINIKRHNVESECCLSVSKAFCKSKH